MSICARYGQSSLVNSFAENRANDLIKALATPNPNAGFMEMRAFVESKGFTLKSPAGRAKLKAYLLANLARMQTEFVQARQHTKPDANRSFQHRGISLDSNLWPDYDLDLALQSLSKAGMLKPGNIRRVAVSVPDSTSSTNSRALITIHRKLRSRSLYWTLYSASAWRIQRTLISTP